MAVAAVRMLCVLALAATLFATYAILARVVLHCPVTGGSLLRSLELATPSTGNLPDTPGRRPCTRANRQSRVWTCDVWDSGGSGSASYRVTLRPGSSCWDARLIALSGDSMPRTASGCVYRWQWQALDIIL